MPLLSKLLENQCQPSKATPANREASAQREIPGTAPSTALESLSRFPSGPLGVFLFKLLASLPQIRNFFSVGQDKVIARVFEQSDARIEVLRQFSHFKELTRSDKFRRLLADRNLAVAHEQYHKGKAAVADFAATLKHQRPEDKGLAIDGIYRGRSWRDLERMVKVSGISAVFCCEHTLFKKNVRASQTEELAGFLRETTFAPILQLAEELSSLLEASQRAFDAEMSRPRVVVQPIPAPCVPPLSQQQPEDFSQAVLENAPTQLYFDDINRNVEDMGLNNLWNFGAIEPLTFPQSPTEHPGALV
ncbi:hypothetical protein PMIN06_011957 [Paraphaeosphaeria minitans]